MRTSHHEEPRHDPLVDMGYETRDLNIRAIRTASIWFFGFTFVSFGIVAVGMAMLGLFDPQAGVEQETMRSKRIPEPPNPLLQTNITVQKDMVELRQRENEALQSYRVADESKGTVAIPIDRAIDLAAQKGADLAGGAPMPVEPNGAPATGPAGTRR